MKKLILTMLISVCFMLQTACTSLAPKIFDSNVQVTNKVIQAYGYSRISHDPQLTEIQNRFASEQAAKINAYRLLAKQLFSEKLTDNLFTGNLLVADQVIKDESYRIYLDIFLREAKVMGYTKLTDQKRVSLELTLSPRFYQCFSSSVQVVSQCLNEDNKIPFTRIGYQQAPMSTVNMACASSNCFGELSISGFSKEKNILDSTLLNFGLYDTEWTVNMALKSWLRYYFLTYNVVIP
jgi:hypothetical protein